MEARNLGKATHMNWDPNEVKAALDMELSVHEDRDERDISKRKFKESVALATDRVIHIALYSDNEPLALKAASYIIDRIHGKTSDTPLAQPEDESLESILRDVHRSVN